MFRAPNDLPVIRHTWLYVIRRHNPSLPICHLCSSDADCFCSPASQPVVELTVIMHCLWRGEFAQR